MFDEAYDSLKLSLWKHRRRPWNVSCGSWPCENFSHNLGHELIGVGRQPARPGHPTLARLGQAT